MMIESEKKTSVKYQIKEEAIVEESEICKHEDELRRQKKVISSKKKKFTMIL